MKYLEVLIWPFIYFVGQVILLLIVSNLTSVEYVNNNPLIVVLIMLFFIPVLYKVYKKLKKDKKFDIKGIYEPIFYGITISIIFNISLYNINNVYNITDNFNDSTINIFVLILSSGIVGPIIEELLFRGIVYNKLKKITKPMPAIILTSLIFALFHTDIVNAIYAFGVSFVLIYIYEKYKNIKYPIIMHMFLNITILLLLDLIKLNILWLNISLVIVSLIILLILRKLIKK